MKQRSRESCLATALVLALGGVGGAACTVKVNQGGSDTTANDAASPSTTKPDAADAQTANVGDGGTSSPVGDGAGPIVDGAASDAPEPCGAVTADGLCQGDNFVYCRAGVLTKVDCARIGGSCQATPAVDGGAAAASCVQQRSEPCGNLDKLGTCDGTILRYCDQSGQIAMAKAIHCAAYGQKCDPHGATDNGAICVPYGACQGVTEDGTCAANALSFCEDAKLYRFDCGLDECRTTSSGVSDCFMAGVTTGCGGVTAGGACDSAGVLTKCLGNVVTHEDCAALGLACQPNATGGFACLPAATCSSCPTGYGCTSGRCVPPASTTRDWTFAVYIVGDNNLADAAWADLNEMEAVGSTAQVQVVAQYQLSSRYAVSVPEAYRTGVYRLPIGQDQDRDNLSSMSNATTLGNVDMSSSATLASFVKWAAETYPAKRLALVLWDHGMGYQGGFVSSTLHTSMSLRKLLDGVRSSGVHADLLGFDACLMGQHEVAMAMRGVADVLLASEQVEPGSGYPYTPILTQLEQTPTMSAQDLGKVVVDAYIDSFTSSFRNQSVTMSVIDLSRAEATNERLSSFAQTLNSQMSGQRAGLRSATSSSAGVLRFEDPNSADMSTALTSFARVGGEIQTAAADLQSWLVGAQGPILRSRAIRNVESAKGLAFFLPDPGSSGSYMNDFEDYRKDTSFLPLQPWQAVLANLSSASADTPVDAGTTANATSSFSVVLTWAKVPDGAESKGDLDLYVYEPDGGFGTPSNGSVSENGLLSADSADTGKPRESYELKPDHQSGTYIVLVHAYSVPAGEQAFPRLQVFRDDLPGGSRTLVRGKFVGSEIQEVPMDLATPLTVPIDGDNVQTVMNLGFSNIWYAATIEVK